MSTNYKPKAVTDDTSLINLAGFLDILVQIDLANQQN
jgi:hypothetical protein